jgi:hypothetical protein
MALQWRDVCERVLSVERAAAEGAFKETKTGKTRTV